ncbi:TerC family protein [Paenibacillus sp. 481]|uniref:TerC family protein n=1 Tax=Paenibacillus sp. 481 TaxID=2835869 RepID=UPI001E293207|nr:TerC family protein [Paenibacillus sp. 481]UHA74148.1 TerC family protein [Paenibacillus sp. 481]
MEQLWLLAEILLINVVLSGDNAVVIAMSSQHLPERERRQAIWWGAAGAVVLRCLLTVVAVWLMDIPLVQAAGGVMLFVIAIQLLNDSVHDLGGVKEVGSLWSAVRTILIADFIMSLDNVLAIAAVAKGQMAYIILGIALSIPIIVWGSAFVTDMMRRFPSVVLLGAGILGFTSGEMISADQQLSQWLPSFWGPLHTLLPWLVLTIVLFVGFVMKRQGNKV